MQPCVGGDAKRRQDGVASFGTATPGATARVGVGVTGVEMRDEGVLLTAQVAPATTQTVSFVLAMAASTAALASSRMTLRLLERKRKTVRSSARRWASSESGL